MTCEAQSTSSRYMWGITHHSHDVTLVVVLCVAHRCHTRGARMIMGDSKWVSQCRNGKVYAQENTHSHTPSIRPCGKHPQNTKHNTVPAAPPHAVQPRDILTQAPTLGTLSRHPQKSHVHAYNLGHGAACSHVAHSGITHVRCAGTVCRVVGL